MVRVYLDTPNLTGGVEIATFTDEKYYDVCWRQLEKLAEQEGYIITESITEEETMTEETYNVTVKCRD